MELYARIFEALSHGGYAVEDDLEMHLNREIVLDVIRMFLNRRRCADFQHP